MGINPENFRSDADLCRPKERNGESAPLSPLFFVFFFASLRIRTHSLKQSLGQEQYDRYRELGHCSF